MFKKLITHVVIVALLSSWFPYETMSQDRVSTIAVIDLDSNGVSEAEARSLSNELRSYITQLIQSREFREKSDTSYTVLERAQMDKIFDQFEIQNFGCTDLSCALEFGKMLSAQFIVIGSVGSVGETNTLTLSLVDIESSVVLKSASYKAAGKADILLHEGIPEVSRTLFGLGKKFPWKKTLLITGAVVVGVATYFLMQEPPEEPGEISIAIPSPQE